MSGRFIGYPTGWILAVVDPADVAGMDAELATAGLDADGRMILSEPDDARRLDGLGRQLMRTLGRSLSSVVP